MKKNKEKISKKLIQSTQQNLSIKDIVNGVIVTKDNRYVKILEVLPVPYFLKTVKERNNIYENFSRLLKTGPVDLQIKTINLSADLSVQLDILNKEMAEEKIQSCKTIDIEYRNRLLDSQETGISRRFFIIFSYKPQANKLFSKINKLQVAINELDGMAANITAYLKACGNEVVVPKKESINEYTTKLLYILLNRGKYVSNPFEEATKEVYERYFKEYGNKSFYIPPADYIAPKKITFIDLKYVVIDDMYYRFAYIPSNGYDQYLSIGWVNIFSNTFVGVDVDVFLNKMPKEQVVSSIRRNLSYSMVGMGDAAVTSEAYDSAGSLLTSGAYLKNGLSGNEDFYYMSTLVTVCDSDPEMVDYKMNELIKAAKSSDFKLKEIIFEAEQAFKSTLPLCKLDKVFYDKAKRNVLTEGATTAYPFTAFEINDPDGVYLGDDSTNGSLAIVDIFHKKKITNSNVFISGQTGAGKTYTLLLLAIRMRIKHIPVFIIAPEKENEFKRVCAALGGQFIGLGSGSNTRINIMEIFMRNKEADEIRRRIDGSLDNRSQLAEKVDAIKSFIQLLVSDMSIEQKQLLDEAIYETYARFGITRDNDSLWADNTKTSYKKMPILEDLYNVIEEKSKTESSLKSVYNTMKFFVKGSGASFNGQTNIDLSNDFIVFGLEHLSDESIPLGIFLTMDYCWSKIKQDATKRKALFIDEWWKMAINPIAAAYSMEISKVIRAYNGAMVIATQQMNDIMLVDDGKFGSAVLNNCAIKILMKMTENDAMKVQELLMLTDDETEKIYHSEKGKALFVYGTDKMQIQFIATPTEDRLITTDSKQLMEIANQNMNASLIQNMKKKKKSRNDLSSIMLRASDFCLSDDAVLYDSKHLKGEVYNNLPTMLNSQQYLKVKGGN